ncbi:hypothetical protein ABT095_22080 [Kitasatospora sp. NPDC002227]|uniref:hypothetical protein n=1 Tax=Kitasatospora sp. NPDC002227 TaxID=3154773 RepID=UPI0033261C72
MGELRGSHRWHFGLAVALGGLALLDMASTWLPGDFAPSKWLVFGVLVAVFPVFTVAMFRSSGPARLMRRGNSVLFLQYVLALPTALKIGYPLVLGLAALGFATGAGPAQDAQTDSSGYYYTYLDKSADPQHEVRVDLTEAGYHKAVKAELRIFSAAPVPFLELSSFLVLVSASEAASAATPPATSAARRRRGRR